MRVRVRNARLGTWYDESLGLIFDAWINPMMPGVYFVHPTLFIIGEDVEVVR